MSKNRNLNDLDSNFEVKAKKFFENTRIKELWVVFDEWLRTAKRQQELYSQWRTKPWNIVTWLDWVKDKSIHQSWKAFDIFFMENWKATWNKPIEIWKEVAFIAKNFWINWGYDLWGWDKPHFQDNPWIPAENLLKIYKNNNDKMDKINKKVFQSLRALIWALWNTTNDEWLKKLLAELWKYMDWMK